jgi:hypothetical protein
METDPVSGTLCFLGIKDSINLVSLSVPHHRRNLLDSNIRVSLNSKGKFSERKIHQYL